MYYLVNEWSLDDERLRKDLEQIGIPIQPLQIENILDFFFLNRKNKFISAYDWSFRYPRFSVCEWGYCC